MNTRGETIKKLGLNHQRGTALILSLLVLLVLSIIGIYAVVTATMETKISGIGREFKVAFCTADSGEPIGIKITKIVIQETPSDINNLPSPWNNVADSSLLSEIFTNGRPSPDDRPTDSPDIDSQKDPSNLGLSSNVRLMMDIDRLRTFQLAGGATEFGSGYEGIGRGGGGDVGILFSMDSLGKYTLAQAESEIESGYLHVVGMPEGN